MFSMNEHDSMLGPAWYILQTLRACNVLALLSVAMTSMIMVVKTNMITSFFVFQAISHTVTCGVAMMLLISELPQPRFVKDFYRHNWPTFSTVDACNRGHSLAWLGAWMVALGVWVMGSLNASDLIATLSFPLWRLTLASGILAVVFGVFNFVVSAVFRNGPHNITVRMIREHGANVYNVHMTTAPPDYGLDTSTLHSSERSNSIRKEKQEKSQFNFHRPFPAAANRMSQTQNRFSKLFFKNDTKKPQISAPVISAPINVVHEQERDVEAAYPPSRDRQSWEDQDRASPIAPHLQVSKIRTWVDGVRKDADSTTVQRPPTALHPAYTVARSSVYSEASHLNRF